TILLRNGDAFSASKKWRTIRDVGQFWLQILYGLAHSACLGSFSCENVSETALRGMWLLKRSSWRKMPRPLLLTCYWMLFVLTRLLNCFLPNVQSCSSVKAEFD